jgi:hypothetical protein
VSQRLCFWTTTSKIAAIISLAETPTLGDDDHFLFDRPHRRGVVDPIGAS